ncbi:MAG: DNA gyrase subunit A [Candidatus Micrarchaeota archaeon]|nr:DNA gyrase subunit A [Candidatus Micrarchaeota archaeon]
MQNIKNVLLEDELQSSYIDYAMSVIIGRAIPDVRDGLKPVNRRILYAMYNINNVHNQPTKKSARVVGDVIGKYHPHGDSAVYESLVRMAQDFSMNHTFVEGQGNFGSVDGDPPAAMRYTEVRLTKLAEGMIDDLERKTVDMIPNYDNTEQEPDVLPAKIPNLLVNGTYGIAVGVSTSMPPHNLIEVCDAISHVLENEGTTPTDILNIIKGPDFPTGGIALISENTYNGYKYGRGQVTIKAKAEIDTKENQIILHELPYSVNKSALIQNIAELVKEKRIVGITDIRDESDTEIRVVIELRGDVQPEVILNSLYKHTQLETTFPIINLAILGKKLKNFNILELLLAFINHRREIITRRSTFELNVAKDRIHIVEGLLVAITNIDQMVKQIKESRELASARALLMKHYELSEKQANAILDMKLSKLTNLEFTSLTDEKAELEGKISHYSGILADPKKVDAIIKSETLEVKKEYGRPRKTQLLQDDGSSDRTEEDLIADDRITVIFTSVGYVKRMNLTTYKEQARGGRGVIAINLKEGDFVKQIITCKAKDYLICISDKGRAYWLKAYRVPESSRYAEGKAIVNLLNLKDEKIVTIMSIKNFEESRIMFLTTRGLIKKISAKLFAHPRVTGVRAITLNQGDTIADAQIYAQEKYIMIATKKGKSIKFDDADVRALGRSAMGVRGIRLGSDDVAKNIIPVEETGYLLTVTEHGYGKLTEISKYRDQNRSGSGIINLKVSPKTGDVAKSVFVHGKSKVLIINSKGVTIKFEVDEIRITGRSASGVRLMKVESSAKVVDARVLDGSDIDAPSPVSAAPVDSSPQI